MNVYHIQSITYIFSFNVKTAIFSILALLLMGTPGVDAQESLYAPIKDYRDIVVIDSFDSDTGFYVFIPGDTSGERELVVFSHGYGALNPKIYGQWIAHLVEQGHIVVFPRYQMSILSTATEMFVPNVVNAIKRATSLLGDRGIQINTSALHLIGHSYGGVISANIAANYESLGLPQVATALLCEPGSGPFSGGLLETYAALDSNLLLAIVVGDKDRTVGQKLGLQIFDTAVGTPQRVLFWQYEDENGEESIGASHYEPYSFDTLFDNGITNFTVNRAEKVSNIDQVDRNGYWQIFDALMERYLCDNRSYTRQLLTELADLGTWSDGSPVRSMDIRTPERTGK